MINAAIAERKRHAKKKGDGKKIKGRKPGTVRACFACGEGDHQVKECKDVAKREEWLAKRRKGIKDYSKAAGGIEKINWASVQENDPELHYYFTDIFLVADQDGYVEIGGETIQAVWNEDFYDDDDEDEAGIEYDQNGEVIQGVTDTDDIEQMPYPTSDAARDYLRGLVAAEENNENTINVVTRVQEDKEPIIDLDEVD